MVVRGVREQNELVGSDSCKSMKFGTQVELDPFYPFLLGAKAAAQWGHHVGAFNVIFP